MTKKSNNQSKKLVKKEERQAEVKRVREGLTNINKNSLMFFEPEPKIEELIDLEEKKRLTAKEKEKRDELVLELAMAYGLKNGIWAVSLGYKKNQSFLDTARRDFVKEYYCKTSIELMLT